MPISLSPPDTLVERERKFDVDPDQPVPHLEGTGPVAAQGDPVETTLHATYFDTPDYSLARRGITLRRRTGGDDEGWHLKLPVDDDAREEQQLPLEGEADRVPEQYSESLRRYVDPARLGPAVHLKTTRRSYALATTTGAVLATLTDDQVAGEIAGDTVRLDGWRELEVELAPAADPVLLNTLAEALVAAGARPAHWPSKLRRLLGDRLHEDEPEFGRRSTAGEVVSAYLRRQLEAVREHDLGVRRNEEDSVHQLRVSLRRIRSALTGFPHVLDREATRELADEVRWAGGELSATRDLEVVRAHLTAQLDALPEAAVVGNARAVLDGYFDRRAREAHEQARTALKSGRYAAMIGSLERLVADPPLTGKAGEPARSVLGKALDRRHRKLAATVAKAADTEPGPDLDTALHDVRKKAKRARYAADAVRPVGGKGLRRWQHSVKSIQSTLGDHHDSVVAREVLRELATTPAGFTFGVLYEREVKRGEKLRRRFTSQWPDVSAP